MTCSTGGNSNYKTRKWSSKKGMVHFSLWGDVGVLQGEFKIK